MSVLRPSYLPLAGEDDSISGASTSDVQDRLSSLELRVQQQEDEITVLKAALADVLRRLALSEDQTASLRKTSPGKGQPVLREAYSLSCITNGSSMTRKPMHSSALSVARKETLASVAKSYGLKEQKSNPEKNEKHEEKETNGETRPNHQNQAQTCQSSQSPQSQSHTQENKNPASAKSVKRSSTIERSQNVGLEGTDESRNKMLRAHSTSKLLKHKSTD
ncbi:echinoderm microtubule-associated protein-like 4, partial [Rhinoraja longicauda]